MGSPVLTQAATIMCPHGGQAVAVPQNMMVQVSNSPVLVQTDVFTIAGCTFQISGSPAPCLTAQWSTASTVLFVNNVPVLLQSSVGLCMGGSGGVPAIITPPQMTVTAD